MVMELPSDLYEQQTRRATEENDHDTDHRFQSTQRLSFLQKESKHSFLFGDKEKESEESDTDLSREFVTNAYLELPLELKDGDLKVEKRVRTKLHCEIPRSAANGEFSASFGASSFIRGPLGYATGQMAVAYHLSNHSKIMGGMHVGDVARLYAGVESGTEKPKQPSSWRWNAMLYTLPNEPCVGTSLSTERTWNSFFKTELSLDCPSNKQPRGRVSVSTLAMHPIQLDVGWRNDRPEVQFNMCPKLSDYLHSDVSLGMDSNGSWCVGATLNQPLTTKAAPSTLIRQKDITEVGTLRLGFRFSKKGLEWILSWSQRDANITFPISVATRPVFDAMYPIQALYLSFVSAFIQEGIAEIWNSSVSILDDAEKQQNQQQQVFLQQRKARRDAEQQRELMVRQATLRQKAEEEDNGLVILEASYFIDGGDEFDVTTQLQFWTSDSTLELPASSKKHLLGFYDVAGALQDQKDDSSSDETSWWSKFWTPCERRISRKEVHSPTLTVRYQFSGDVYQITVEDNEALILPSSEATQVDS